MGLYLSSVLNTGVIFICLRAVGKYDLSIASLKLDNRYSHQICQSFL